MVSKYEAALKLARLKKRATRRVYDLLLEADRSGDARATYALATWFLFGNRFCKKDYRQAVAMLQRVAVANISAAAYDLAISYEKGIGVRKSLKRAFENYVRAALLGDAQSYFEVGRMYFHGLGTARNRILAEIWYSKAAELGVKE